MAADLQVQSGLAGLDLEQLAGAEAIFLTYRARGLNPAGGIAVALNESGLVPSRVNPNDQGPGRNSTGLFQEGPGYGSAAQLLDPVYNATVAAKADAAAGGAGKSARTLQVLQTTAFERPKNPAGDESPANLARAEQIVAALSAPFAQVQARVALTSVTGGGGGSSLFGQIGSAAAAASGGISSVLSTAEYDLTHPNGPTPQAVVTDVVGGVESALNWLDPANWVRSITNWISGKALLVAATIALVGLGAAFVFLGIRRMAGGRGLPSMPAAIPVPV
jgi:hypothetical protein